MLGGYFIHRAGKYHIRLIEWWDLLSLGRQGWVTFVKDGKNYIPAWKRKKEGEGITLD